MLPDNIRLLESAAHELRELREKEPKIFIAVVGALSSLARQGAPSGTRRFPVTSPSGGRSFDLVLFGFDLEGCRILFEGERIVTRTKEGWDLVRTISRAGESFVYTVWAFVRTP